MAGNSDTVIPDFEFENMKVVTGIIFVYGDSDALHAKAIILSFRMYWLPYKHYDAEVVSGVLDGFVKPEDQDSEDYPSVSTMLYWLRWFQLNLANMEGYLRNAGYRFLRLGEELLFSDQSLLKAVRKKYLNWLERTIRIIYNSGGFLPAFYW